MRRGGGGDGGGGDGGGGTTRTEINEMSTEQLSRQSIQCDN